MRCQENICTDLLRPECMNISFRHEILSMIVYEKGRTISIIKHGLHQPFNTRIF